MKLDGRGCLSNEVKYFGVIFDPQLTYNRQLQSFKIKVETATETGSENCSALQVDQKQEVPYVIIPNKLFVINSKMSQRHTDFLLVIDT